MTLQKYLDSSSASYVRTGSVCRVFVKDARLEKLSDFVVVSAQCGSTILCIKERQK